MEKVLEQNEKEEILLPDDPAYLAKVQDILENKAFLSMKDYIQHGVTSCLQHCIAVSYHSYHTCLAYGLNARAAARAGLLHDLFLYDWHHYKREKGEKMHGFSHPKRALENAEKEFDLTDLEKEIILRHMWPLTLRPPKHKEAYVVIYHDKMCSMRETFGKQDELLTTMAAKG